MQAHPNEVRIGIDGNLTIPPSLCKALGFHTGDQLIARQSGEKLILERRTSIEQRLQNRFRQIPSEVSLVDELISERRLEAKKEAVQRN